jgi:hypothetical protein
MCPLLIFWRIISLTTCCVLGGPLNFRYLREPPHCFVEGTNSRQMSVGLTPAAVVVTFSLLSPHVRTLLSVVFINIGGLFILSQVRIFWRVYAINLKGAGGGRLNLSWLYYDVSFKVFKSLRYHTIQINHQLDATISPVYYLDVYLQLNLFRASSRPSSVAQQLQ